MEQKKNYTLPIVMMFLLFAMISFVTGLSNPLGVIVKNQFAVANWMSQLGNFANFIAYAVMGIPAGMMLKRIGYKKTALAAVAVGFVGVGIQYLSGIAGSFPVYLIGAFVSGFSMCMLNTVVNPMLNTLGGGGKKGNQLIQFGGSLNSISATIVPILVGYLMGNAANATISDAAPALWIAMGIFAVVFFVLAAVRISRTLRDPGRQEREEGQAQRHVVPSLRAGYGGYLYLCRCRGGHSQLYEPVPDLHARRGDPRYRNGCCCCRFARGHLLVPDDVRPSDRRRHRRQGLE